ncbi:MAG TPA: hypothetical protein VNG13_06280 [Mycobacteriales bacterium]|nr:hypothetical protein [Mycobacteriales bacterium]
MTDVFGSATAVVVIAASARLPLASHLWHLLEGAGFLVTALIGIAAGEHVERRHRRASKAATTAAGQLNLHTRATNGPEGEMSPSNRQRPPTVVTPGETGGGVEWGAILLTLMAVASAAAAGVHYVVMPAHFREATLYGVFFALAATVQLGYAGLLITRASRPLIVVGVAGNLTIVLLWLLTRTVAIPLGPAAGSTEGFGGLDILASTFEAVAAAAGMLILLRHSLSSRPAVRRAALSPVCAVIAGVAALALATTATFAPPS